MAGIEVLGALAAASQLTEQGFKISVFISDLYSKVRDAPESIRKQSVQIEQLIDIARLIKHNPPLQTVSVESILRSCVVVAEELQKILGKISTAAGDGRVRKLWNALDGVIKEKRILALLANLEREKSSLALCIEAIDSALLYTIQDTLPGMAGDIKGIHDILPSLDTKVTAVHNELPTISGKITAIHDAMQHLTLNTQISVSTSESDVVKGFFVVPYARNPSFIGREAYIEDLSKRLELEKKHNSVALVGLGGIGQVALEYAYRRHEKSPEISIFWVHASNASRFEQGYLQIAVNAKLPGINDPKREIKQLVKNWLGSRESGTWLMIIDNADDSDMFFGARKTGGSSFSSECLSEFLPQCPNGSIVFTTRNKKAGVKFATARGVLRLPEMDPVDAEELLKARLGEDISDRDIMTKLLELLEYLPLAICQAGSYIAENSISISKYLQMYNESEASRIELLSENFEGLETTNPVTATWVISFDQIRQSDILAANLLSFMACLDRQGIPIALLPSTESSVRLSNALGLLKAYSLVTESQNDLVFDMHRLVYLATRNWLRLNDTFEDWAEQALVSLSKHFPLGSYENRKKCSKLLPHVQPVLSSSKSSRNTAVLKARGTLLYNVAWFLGKVKGKYDEAEIYGRECLEVREQSLEATNIDRLASIREFCLILLDQGKYEAAEKVGREALEQYEKTLGKEHLDTLASVNNLAMALQYQHKYDAAKAMCRRALGGREKVLGPEHPDTLVSVSNLASVLQHQGEYEAAEAMNRQALERREKVLGPEHPHTLVSVNNLALVLQDQGKYEAAEAMNRRALERKEKVLGPEHPSTLVSVSNLASVLRYQGKYEAVKAMN